jgi:hypothetical protein
LTSIGSPSGVPVPCASTYPISSGVMPARSYTDASSSACDAALGAVIPLVFPSPFVPLARITPWMWSPSASARSSRFSATTPTPSPSTMPSADASNGADVPVGESMPVLLHQTCICGVFITATPPASAASHSPRRMLSQARCTATSEEEHAVSTAMVGPLRLSR